MKDRRIEGEPIGNSSSRPPVRDRRAAIWPRGVPRQWPLAGFAIGLSLLACASVLSPGAAEDLGEPFQRAAIEHVAVLDLQSDRLIPDQTILLAGRSIEAVGPANRIEVPAGALRFDGSGRIAMPGLSDMHVHSVTTDRLALLGYGITTVRVMWGTPAQAGLALAVEAGDSLGPEILLASPGHDGTPASWPLTRFVLDAAAAGPAVAQVAAEGWRWLKVYDRLSLPAYRALLAEAHARNVEVVGHVPFAVPLDTALALRQRSIEHLAGYAGALNGTLPSSAGLWATANPAAMPALAARTAAAGTWNCPTLVTTITLAKALFPASAAAITRNRRAMVKALFDAGAPLLIGTDSGIDVVPPGSALIDELAEFVVAGIPPAAALSAATVGAARFLGRDAAGTLTPGAPANVLILDRDPRTSLETLRAPRALFVSGRRLDRDDLARLRSAERSGP
ncbi:MAG: amidohydrolase family protein [Gemmatimonadales bacterium]